jgi:hypothetical protein
LVYFVIFVVLTARGSQKAELSNLLYLQMTHCEGTQPLLGFTGRVYANKNPIIFKDVATYFK